MVSTRSFLTAAALASAALASPVQRREYSNNDNANAHVHGSSNGNGNGEVSELGEPVVAGGSKRGLAFNYRTNTQLFDTGAISWSYNWNPAHPGEQPVGEFVPMLGSMKDLDYWHSAMASHGQVSHILGFNEPDHAGQANMSPGQTAAYYKQYITPYQQEAQLGSPACTSANEPGKGLDWMGQFLSLCSDCGIDFMTTHWYANPMVGGEQNAVDFLNYVDSAVNLAHQHGIDKVWITEFGFGYGSPVPRQERTIFMEKVLPALDANPAIERYAYFLDLNLEDGDPSVLEEEAKTYIH
ncbi:hypothetical protein KEM52_000705 [Ascosphaera acerosa]|nr:hypothetical protein KEM52_000705 [Ascosphaera acerosa]